MKSLIVLTQTECKRIIARGIMLHPLVKKALKSGKIFIARGSTNAFIVEELTNNKIEKNRYVAGQIVGDNTNFRRFSIVESTKRLNEIIIDNGSLQEVSDLHTEISSFGPSDLILKGASVIGEDWIAGVYMSNDKAGTIGIVMPVAIARGIPIVIPVSLIKRSSERVMTLAEILGNKTFNEEFTMGDPIGIMPIPGEIFTELDALELLYPEVDFYHIGSGGVGKAEGALHFLLEGDEEEVQAAYSDIIEIIKKESETYQPIA